MNIQMIFFFFREKRKDMGKVKILATISELTRVIGKNGKLPWGYIPEMINHFREEVKDSIVICGKKSFYTFVDHLNASDLYLLKGDKYLYARKNYNPIDESILLTKYPRITKSIKSKNILKDILKEVPKRKKYLSYRRRRYI